MKYLKLMSKERELPVEATTGFNFTSLIQLLQLLSLLRQKSTKNAG